MTSQDAIKFPEGLTFDKIATLLCDVYDTCHHVLWSYRGRTFLPAGFEPCTANGVPEWAQAHWAAKYYAPMVGGVTEFWDAHADEDVMRPEWKLDAEAIQRGLDCFKAKAPKHFARACTELHDPNTGDVFLQLCLFGEVRYGIA